MKGLVGRPGSVSGLVLRLGQCAFAASAIGVMVGALGFSTFTAFCYLIASMGLQVLWSFGLACLDIYALTRKRDLQNPILVSLFVVGDWVFNLFLFIFYYAFLLRRNKYEHVHQVTATLTLAAACSSAGIIVLYSRDLGFCKEQHQLPCEKFQMSVAFAFITWALTAISSHVMFWILLASV